MEFNTRIDEQCRAQAVDTEKRTVRFLAQSPALASDDLVILPTAGKRRHKEFMKNPIVVPYHQRMNMDGDPVVVGSVVETEFKPDGMYQTVKFADTERAEQFWTLYRDGHMRMVSIAWGRDDKVETNPAKMERLLAKHNITLKPDESARLRGVVTEYQQRDLSLVAIGADPRAMVRSAPEAAADMMDNYRFDDERGLYLDEFKPPKRIVVVDTDEPDVDEPTGGALVPLFQYTEQAVREGIRKELLAFGFEPKPEPEDIDATDDNDAERDDAEEPSSDAEPSTDEPNGDTPNDGERVNVYADLLNFATEQTHGQPAKVVSDDLLDLATDANK